MTELFLRLHEWQSGRFAAVGGEHFFLIESFILGVILCIWGIPRTTDWMVDSSAGLAGKYLGAKTRTLVINVSTNNPELANMLVALGMGRAGGIANPLGSNFANLYLMYLLAPMIVIVGWFIRGRCVRLAEYWGLLWKERSLVVGHVGMAFLMFLFSTGMYWAMTGYNQFGLGEGQVKLRSSPWLVAAVIIGCLGVLIFFLWEFSMRRKHPALFEKIDDSQHTESWLLFFVGTGGLIFASMVLNAIFLAWTAIYGVTLSKILGEAVFAGLHYFLGAIITSLPEVRVAIRNYERLSVPDLNTALASASVSNMMNLVLGVLGILIVLGMIAFGWKVEL
ncbi:MAG: hypothetical protein N2035_03870 [Chthoniobacterales bacterium]|nr:hypothetical protein [Chthoniobacterales bacterium]